jgi:hypothetical protein
MINLGWHLRMPFYFSSSCIPALRKAFDVSGRMILRSSGKLLSLSRNLKIVPGELLAKILENISEPF